MQLRPFVYLSESLITTQNGIQRVVQCARDHGYDPDLPLLEELWEDVMWSNRAQLRKYKILADGFRQEALRNWFQHVTDRLAPSIFSPHTQQTSDPKLTQAIFKSLSDPRSYQICEPAAQFVADLESNDINWGIIANSHHLYPQAVKYLGLRPLKIVSASQNLFKPLPVIFENAWRKVPVASRHDVWFVADSKVAYDNVYSKYMRTAVYTHGRVCDKSSRHLRIASFKDLYPELGLEQDLDLDFDMGADELREFLVLPKNQLLERGDRELGLVDVPRAGEQEKKW